MGELPNKFTTLIQLQRRSVKRIKNTSTLSKLNLCLFLGVFLLTSCGSQPSASDQKICDFVADNSLNLFVPTNLQEL